MSFLSPIWLIAIAAVSIPVIIHLWNIRPGKTLKVGSISLIETSSRKRSRSLKLIDILLLILRSLFLVILAFILALPFIKSLPSKGKSKGWLLIPKEHFNEAYQKFKKPSDSLTKAGYELHYFNSGFKRVAIGDALADTGTEEGQPKIAYWSLLQQLNRQIPPGLPVYLITPALLKDFTLQKPEIGFNLNWRTYTPVDSNTTWVQKAWFTDDKNVQVVIGTSKPSGTYFNAATINISDQKQSPYTINATKGKAFISLKNSSGGAVEIDTEKMAFDVFAGKNTLDASYVKAALQTIGQFVKYPVIIKPFVNGGDPAIKKSWLFWLSDSPPDKKLFNQYKHILVYASGKINQVNSWIVSGTVNAVSREQQQISLYKSVGTANTDDEVIWHDGFGKPILSYNNDHNTGVYQFYSRFNPSWNDLVWKPQFPRMLLQLIFANGKGLDKDKYDNRAIDAKQIMPVRLPETHISKNSYPLITGLTKYFWLLLVIIFCLERWLANRKKLTI